MNRIKIVLIGLLMEVLILTSFSLLDYVIKDSEDLQALIVAFLIIPFASLGAYLYYRDGNKDHGLKVGLVTVAIALSCDCIFTIPFIIIPKGGSYLSFFSYPLLYVLILSNISTFYVYWRLRIK